jgi:hypothetical protein
VCVDIDMNMGLILPYFVIIIGILFKLLLKFKEKSGML